MVIYRTKVKLPAAIKVTAKAVLPLTATVGDGGGDVNIIDQDENVIETITAPGEYQVEVVSEITDDEDLNTVTIIDPLQ